MKKSYAEICLERAEKATALEWIHTRSDDGEDHTLRHPGRELDALVAEKVMGHDLRASPFRASEPFDLSAPNQSIPHYSTDISAAWEIVEKLKFGFYELSYNCLSPESFHASIGDDLKIHEGSPEIDGFKMKFIGILKSYEANGQSAPHAICLAALKSVGVEI